jgi:SAM-dependent methyltransferase
MGRLKNWHDFGASIEHKAEIHKQICDSLGSNSLRNRYLDIGAGNGAIALTLGKEFNEILGLDVGFWEYPGGTNNPDLKKSRMQCVIGTANELPFADETFDLVSIISVIEHIPLAQQKHAIDESIRVLRPGGELFVHLPYRYFPLCLHSSLPNPAFLPKKIRIFVLKVIGYSWLLDVDIPTVKSVKKWMVRPKGSLRFKPVVWPEELVPPKLRVLYKIGKPLGVFKIFPFGHAFLFKKF